MRYRFFQGAFQFFKVFRIQFGKENLKKIEIELVASLVPSTYVEDTRPTINILNSFYKIYCDCWYSIICIYKRTYTNNFSKIYKTIIYEYLICVDDLRATSHYGRPSREAMGLSGQTFVEIPTKWADNS